MGFLSQRAARVQGIGPLTELGSEGNGWRAAVRSNVEEEGVGGHQVGDRAAGVVQSPLARDDRSLEIGAERARRTRRAVQRRPQLTLQIVVLERRRDQEDGVQRRSQHGQPPDASAGLSGHSAYDSRPAAAAANDLAAFLQCGQVRESSEEASLAAARTRSAGLALDEANLRRRGYSELKADLVRAAFTKCIRSTPA